MNPGRATEEIGKSLEDKIIDVMGRIREKQERAEDLKPSITDIEAKLKE
jgi:predicted  nucleic acid-binding Zn-ribbon protein